MMMCETMAEQAKEIKKLKAELAESIPLRNALSAMGTYVAQEKKIIGLKAELADAYELLEKMRAELVEAYRKSDIWQSGVIDLNRQLVEKDKEIQKRATEMAEDTLTKLKAELALKEQEIEDIIEHDGQEVMALNRKLSDSIPQTKVQVFADEIRKCWTWHEDEILELIDKLLSKGKEVRK